MQMPQELLGPASFLSRPTTPRKFLFHQSRRGRVVSGTQDTCLYDFIIAACAMIPPPGRKKLRPAPGVQESIVIQPQPEGRELIIRRFTGIIEQMCFEIGHRTFAAPTVIPQPGLPAPQPDPHGLQCRNSRGGKTERRVCTLCTCCTRLPQSCRTTQTVQQADGRKGN